MENYGDFRGANNDYYDEIEDYYDEDIPQGYDNRQRFAEPTYSRNEFEQRPQYTPQDPYYSQFQPQTVQSNGTYFDYDDLDDDDLLSPTPATAYAPAYSNSAGRPTQHAHRASAYGNMPSQSSQVLNEYAANQLPPIRYSSQKASDVAPHRPRGHGVNLRPVSDLPDIYRGLFKFGVFNAVQSQCFDTVMNSTENMIISAPTSSGKTVLFELAIIERLSNNPHPEYRGPQCVYMAPTKALCAERTKDWTAKFLPVGIKCCELTGDTAFSGKDAWKAAKDSTIIITTPEKWDSLTRNWHESLDFLSKITLFMVDEVHILHEPRGATLEVCVSRMKTRARPRFVFVSATVPNIEDIASWVRHGEPPHPTRVFTFDESYRPCKIERLVFGFSKNKLNDYQFLSMLDNQLFPILQQHAKNKPVVVFCPTRKSVMASAEKIAAGYRKLVDEKQVLPWKLPMNKVNVQLQDQALAGLISAGVAVHHAGLSSDDRRAVEDLFARKQVLVVVSTSTLAVGVNMPAHTVIIHGTRQWQGSWGEYSDLDIMQMIGRAGRPQFDKEGVAIIICDIALQSKYQDLLEGRTILESHLHANLIEHVASEINLGTITDVESGKTWLRNSFFFQRLQKNPSHYASVVSKASDQNWQERLDEILTETITTLHKSTMIAMEKREPMADRITITELGEIMSRYYVRYSTMEKIRALPETVTLRQLLEVISETDELTDPVRLRAEEKKGYNDLRQHNDIRFQLKKVEKTPDKVFVLLQAILGGLSLGSKEFKGLGSQPHLDGLLLFRHASPIVDVGLARKSGSQVKFGMELVRSFVAKAWEDRPVVLRQIPQIGEKSFKVLAQHGIASLPKLRDEQSHRIEALLNRRPLFGHDIIQAVQQMPDYNVSITEEDVTSSKGKKPVEVTVGISVSLRSSAPTGKKDKSLGMTSILVTTSDLVLVDFRRIPTKSLRTARAFSLTVLLEKPSQAVIVSVNPDNFAGLGVNRTYKPVISPSEFPTPNTRPQQSLSDVISENDDALQGFWELSDPDLEDVKPKPAQATTAPPSNKKAAERPARSISTSEPVEKEASAPRVGLARKMENGNYECNHPCKDKTKCRHLCCHEGLPRPPKSIARVPAHNASPKKKAPPTTQAKTPAKPKAKTKTKEEIHDKQMTKASNGAEKVSRSLEDLHRTTKSTTAPPRKRIRTDLGDVSTKAAELLARYTDANAGAESDEDDDTALDPASMFKTRSLSPPIASLGDGSEDSSIEVDPDVDALLESFPMDDVVSPALVPLSAFQRYSSPTQGPTSSPSKGLSSATLNESRQDGASPDDSAPQRIASAQRSLKRSFYDLDPEYATTLGLPDDSSEYLSKTKKTKLSPLSNRSLPRPSSPFSSHDIDVQDSENVFPSFAPSPPPFVVDPVTKKFSFHPIIKPPPSLQLSRNWSKPNSDTPNTKEVPTTSKPKTKASPKKIVPISKSPKHSNRPLFLSDSPSPGGDSGDGRSLKEATTTSSSWYGRPQMKKQDSVQSNGKKTTMGILKSSKNVDPVATVEANGMGSTDRTSGTGAVKEVDQSAEEFVDEDFARWWDANTELVDEL